jgi:undecaprenyl-diphosphatase
MDILDVLVLGIVEGITEFLPISSTAHMMMFQDILGIETNSFVTTFIIVTQLGAMMSVVGIAVRAFRSDSSYGITTGIALIPAVFVGVLVYPFVKQVLLSHVLVSLIAMGVGGIVLVVFERLWKKQGSSIEKSVTKKQAFLVGLFQVLAFVPGVSRSAVTIIGGMVSGLSRHSATLFAFIIAIPTMFGASVYDLSQSVFHFSTYEFGLLVVGFGVSWAVAHVAVSWFLRFVQTTSLEWFGWYRIVFALVGMVFLVA